MKISVICLSALLAAGITQTTYAQDSGAVTTAPTQQQPAEQPKVEPTSNATLALLGNELSSLIKTLKNTRDPKVMCQKGYSATGQQLKSFFSKITGQKTKDAPKESIYSLRSFEGRVCGAVVELYAYSILQCTQQNLAGARDHDGEDMYEGYKKSQCATKGYNAHAEKFRNPDTGQIDMTIAAQVITNSIKERAGVVRDIVCTNPSKLPAFARYYIEPACKQVGAN